MSNTTHKSNNTLPLKTLFKEAALTLFIPHKTFARIPKNPKLNYRKIIPLLFFSGFIFTVLHLVSLHARLAFVTGRTDYGIIIGVPFLSVIVWIMGSLAFYYIGRLFKKNVPLKRVEVAAIYMWFAWFIMPAFDLLHPLLGIPFRLATLGGAQVHFSWFYFFPALAVESFFLLKKLLKLSGKQTTLAVAIAASLPFISRYILEQIPNFIYKAFSFNLPNLISSDFHIIIAPTFAGLVFSLWLAQKAKYGTLKTLGRTALICLLLFTTSTTLVFFAPFPVIPQKPTDSTTVISNTIGTSRFTRSFTFGDTTDRETGTQAYTGTTGNQWWDTNYTGITFNFTPANQTIIDVKIRVHTTATGTNADPNAPPKMQGCYSPNSGTNWYCSDWTSNITTSTTYNFTISPSDTMYCFTSTVPCDTFTKGTDGNATSGIGSAVDVNTYWSNLISQMGTGSTNQARVHALTNSDGAATPTYDDVRVDEVYLIVDYQTKVTGRDWQWYQNKNALQPDTALAAANTATTTVHRNDVLRLRMILKSETSGDLTVTDESFKLQYAQMAGADCAGGDETWVDLGGSTAVTAWRGFINAGVSDGTQISSSLIGGAQLESYEDSNSSVNNPAAIVFNASGEWDWVIQNYLASYSTSYCFRMLATRGTNNGIPFDASYTPKLTTFNETYTNLKGKINIKGKVNLR